jgi:hypothetical protein
MWMSQMRRQWCKPENNVSLGFVEDLPARLPDYP